MTIFSGYSISQDLPDKEFSDQAADTLLLDEYPVDTVKFFLFEDLSKLENIVRDTAIFNIGDKVYRLPLKINAQTIIDYRKQYLYYKLTGVSLYENPELESYVKELFRQPRTKLVEKISAKDWPNSEIYLRYFEQYDQNSQFLAGNQNLTGYDKEELEDEDMAQENYEDFPLPETIDLVVDLRSNPKLVNILGIDFNFEKLDVNFQKLLMGYGGVINDKNRKSNLR